jgi:ketosteroid isomerase-like protein
MPEESSAPDAVELTRLAFEAVNQRDIDAIVSFFGPDAVLDGRAVGGLYEGRAAIRGFLEEWIGRWAPRALDDLHRHPCCPFCRRTAGRIRRVSVRGFARPS